MRAWHTSRPAVVTALLAASVSCSAHVDRPAARAAAEVPVARAAPPNPAVGAVFLGGGTEHTCTAAVLHSTSADLILTAAHCLASGIEATFVPGFDDAAAADDVWHIDAVYADDRWRDDQDPRADYAIARVSRAGSGSLMAAGGGGLTIGRAPQPGAVVTVTGYEYTVGGGPFSCTAPTAAETQGYPSLPCVGVVAGMSGAPWILGSTITGIVGGLHGGGCDENVSYSPPFDDSIARLQVRAETGGDADDVPAAPPDDCD